MQEVAFHFCLINNIRGLEVLDWDAIHTILQRGAFTSLQKLHFQIDGKLKRKKARHFIRGRLHLGDDKGLLSVQDSPEQTSSSF